MPGIPVFKMLKLQYMHKLHTRGTCPIDLVHLMTKKLRPKQSQTQTHKAGKCRYFEKKTDEKARIEKENVWR